MKEKVKSSLVKYNWFYLLLPILLYLAKLLAYTIFTSIEIESNTIDMKIDELIPYCKYFIIFYLTYYFVPIVQLYFLSFKEKRKMFRLYVSIIACCLIACVCFYVFPVKMIRPEIVGNDIFSILVKMIYGVDAEAENCFPSIHALMGTAMVIAGYKSNGFPKWAQIASILAGIGCVLSTVFVKQHYLIDTICGVLLMVVIYLIVLLVDKRLMKKNKIEEHVG